MKSQHWVPPAILFAITAIAVTTGYFIPRVVAEDAKPKKEPVPIETNLHEFMEYVFEPTIHELRESMTPENAKSPAWGKIKSGSLILGEGGNLLLMRVPEESPEDFKTHAITMREYAGELYRHAHKKDFDAARKSYTTMIKSCNQCHQQFAGGEHLQEP